MRISSTERVLYFWVSQAFLLSSCLKKMISEKMVKLAAENPEMVSALICVYVSLYFHHQLTLNYTDEFPGPASLVLKGRTQLPRSELPCLLGAQSSECKSCFPRRSRPWMAENSLILYFVSLYFCLPPNGRLQIYLKSNIIKTGS